jgi:TetR/AcrR family transcriptional regulator, cholesterol catabolism regulator
MTSLKDQDIFPLTNFSMNALKEFFLEYHLRAICTTKGLKTLTQFIDTNQS